MSTNLPFLSPVTHDIRLDDFEDSFLEPLEYVSPVTPGSLNRTFSNSELVNNESKLSIDTPQSDDHESLKGVFVQ